MKGPALQPLWGAKQRGGEEALQATKQRHQQQQWRLRKKEGKKRRNKKKTGIFQDTHMYMIVCTRVVLECDSCHGDVCGMCMLPCKTSELV